MGDVQLPVWTAAQAILAPRTMLGTFIWWAVLGDGLRGIELVVRPQPRAIITQEIATTPEQDARVHEAMCSWQAPHFNIDDETITERA